MRTAHKPEPTISIMDNNIKNKKILILILILTGINFGYNQKRSTCFLDGLLVKIEP